VGGGAGGGGGGGGVTPGIQKDGRQFVTGPWSKRGGYRLATGPKVLKRRLGGSKEGSPHVQGVTLFKLLEEREHITSNCRGGGAKEELESG